MTKKELHEILMRAFIQWPHMTVTVPMTELWFEAFSRIPIDQFRTVMSAALKNSKSGFPPTIGEVQSILNRLVMPIADNLTIGEAWGILMTAINRFGAPNKQDARAFLLKKDKRIIQAINNMGGWATVCGWLIADEVANRAHFWRVYESLKARDAEHDRLGMDRINLSELEGLDLNSLLPSINDTINHKALDANLKKE